MYTSSIIPHSTRDISSLILDANGQLTIVPASVYADTSQAERSKFALFNGCYGLPTTELVDFLTTFIAGRSAMEIGAGNGRLSHVLGIRATDNHQQTEPEIKFYYECLGQAVIEYGANVERIDQVRGKPRPSGRGQERRQRNRSSNLCKPYGCIKSQYATPASL